MPQPFPRQISNPFALGHIVQTNLTVSAASNASPIQITTTTPHLLLSGYNARVAAVGGNTAANGDWTVTVVDATNFTLNGSTGNSAYTSGGTVARFRIPLTVNHPELAGFGYLVNSITFESFSANAGICYVGDVTMIRTTPFTGCVYQLPPKTTQNMPFFSPGNSNIINIDEFVCDFDTVGEGILVSVFIK